MSRIPRCKEPISTTETIQGVFSIIVIVAISMFFGHLYYVATDSESETNKSLDSKFKNFREMGASRFDNEYTIVLKKYEYLKDPNKYHIILEELEALLEKESPCDDGLRPDEWWPHIPGFETLAERINEFERQREEIIRIQQETNYRTRGE